MDKTIKEAYDDLFIPSFPRNGITAVERPRYKIDWLVPIHPELGWQELVAARR